MWEELKEIVGEVGLRNIVAWIVFYLLFAAGFVAGATWIVLTVYRHVMS